MCRNEEWLSAYLEKRLPEQDRRLYEMHLSSCPECLAEFVAAKSELEEIVAEETATTKSSARPTTRRVALPWGWARSRAGRRPVSARPTPFSRSVPLAASLSLAAVIVLAGALMLARHMGGAERDFRAIRPLVMQILAVNNIGDMRLSSGPERPLSNSATYRGLEHAGSPPVAQVERILTRALERHRDSWRLDALFGDLYIADNQVERADNYYARALDLKPGNARLLNDRAVAAYRLGRFDESRRFLEDARTADGARLEILYNLAVLAHEMEERDSELHYVDLYLKKDPSSPWAERLKELAR